MRVGDLYRRFLSERNLFIPWMTVVFSIVFTGFFIWLLNANGMSLVFVALVSLGGGWLLAYYMWEINNAAATAWDSWVKPNGENNTDRES